MSEARLGFSIWGTVIALANSVGLVPIGYFLFGRRNAL